LGRPRNDQPDPDCEPLEDFLGELPDHFEKVGLDLSERWVQAHVVAEIRCNWKIAQEAFMEAWHAGATHLQMVAPVTHEPAAGPISATGALRAGA